jgi:hypothetical protein
MIKASIAQKHSWSKTEAGFIGSSKGAIGKCPNDVSLEEASKVLNKGIPLQDAPQGYPTKYMQFFGGLSMWLRITIMDIFTMPIRGEVIWEVGLVCRE